MYRLKTIESLVRDVLETNPQARDDDMKLYLLVCKNCMTATHGRTDFSFEDVMTNYREFGCPGFESVRRTRQKIQADTPELRCSPEANSRRRRGFTDYKDYALDKED